MVVYQKPITYCQKTDDLLVIEGRDDMGITVMNLADESKYILPFDEMGAELVRVLSSKGEDQQF